MPGIANRTVPRLRAQPGSLLSLLPVRNVKDQPVGGSRREQTHTIKCTHTHIHQRGKYTHLYAYTHMRHARSHTDRKAMRAPDSQKHRQAHPHSGLARYGITSWGLQPGQAMRPQLRWFKTPRWVLTQVGQVELHTRMTAELQRYAYASKCGNEFVLIRVCDQGLHLSYNRRSNVERRQETQIKIHW